MIVSVKPVILSGYKAVELTSDAATNDAALRQIDDWCIRNNASRSRLHLLVEQPNAMGGGYWIGIAYPAESTVARGHEVYDRKVVPTLTAADVGRYAVIDCDSEDFVVASNEFEAIDALEDQHPGARAYVKRIGYKAVAGVGTTVSRSNEV